MTITRTRPDHAPAPEATTRFLGAGAWVRGKSQVASARLITWGMFGGLGIIALLAVVSFFRPPPKAAVQAIPEPTVAPEGFAEMFVATWLTAKPGDSLQPFIPIRVDFGPRNSSIGSSPAPPTVLRTAAVGAVQLGRDYWTITVAANTQVVNGPVLTRFFRVPVLRAEVLTNGSPTQVYVATNTPAEVAGPVGAKLPDLDVGSFRRPEPNDPLASSVTQFLAALLTGKGELGRYTAPDSTVRPISPVPFTGIEVTSLGARRFDGDSEHLEVVATATGIDAAGFATGLTYPLELVLRDGRWEVVRVLYAPTLPDHQDDLTPTPPVPVPTTVTAVPSTTTNPTSSTSTTTRRN